jgi:hypothetical protein
MERPRRSALAHHAGHGGDSERTDGEALSALTVCRRWCAARRPLRSGLWLGLAVRVAVAADGHLIIGWGERWRSVHLASGCVAGREASALYAAVQIADTGGCSVLCTQSGCSPEGGEI